MQSKWFHLKEKAIQLRNEGRSIRDIEKYLKIPKSTLSGWFKGIVLTNEQLLSLKNNHTKHLNIARKMAIKWHNQQKEARLKEAENQALKVLSEINYKDLSILELALAMLYLGEGAKTKSGIGMGNSDPQILKFLINSSIRIYNIDKNKIKCWLHLRADQNQEEMEKYWSKELDLPIVNFMACSIDLRTVGKPTFPNYHGVCVVRCGNIAFQRKLMFIARKYCETINKRAVSSVGRAQS